MKRPRRRTNLLWGLVLVGIALVLVLRAFALIPDGIYDIFLRAWPVLLVLGGLSILLRDRVPFGSGLSLALSLALVGGMTALAFSSRAAVERSDYREPVDQPIGDSVTVLEISIETLATDVELLRSLDTDARVSGQFTGSTESKVEVIYEESDGRAFFRLGETQPNPFPMLDAAGRGRLRLELPANYPIDLAFRGIDGTVTFNLGGLALERLNIRLDRGDALVTFPSYAPLSPTVAEQPGNLMVSDGDITIVVPRDVAARLELNLGSGIEPLFDEAIYNYLRGDVLEDKDYDDAAVKLRYIVTVPRGRIRVESVSE